MSVNEEIETLLKFATLVKAKKLNQIRGLEEVASRNNFTQELIKLMKDIETADEVDPGTVLKADSKLAKALLGDVSPVSGFAAQMESLQEQASVASPPPLPPPSKLSETKAKLDLDHLGRGAKAAAPKAPDAPPAPPPPPPPPPRSPSSCSCLGSCSSSSLLLLLPHRRLLGKLHRLHHPHRLHLASNRQFQKRQFHRHLHLRQRLLVSNVRRASRLLRLHRHRLPLGSNLRV